jgi:hypothetical protein
MTIWGIGTGRCGTATLAITRGGAHEPKPWLFMEAMKYYQGERSEEVMTILRDRLQARMRSLFNFIVDQKQSVLVPLIVEVDSEAKFVWLIREPVDCVKSMMAFGFYARTIEKWDLLRIMLDESRVRPKEGFPDSWSLETKCFWYWHEVNSVIERDLVTTGAPFEMVFTHDLGPVVYNSIAYVLKKQTRKDGQSFVERPDNVFKDAHTVEFYREFVEPFWNRLV